MALLTSDSDIVQSVLPSFAVSRRARNGLVGHQEGARSMRQPFWRYVVLSPTEYCA